MAKKWLFKNVLVNIISYNIRHLFENNYPASVDSTIKCRINLNFFVVGSLGENIRQGPVAFIWIIYCQLPLTDYIL